MCIDQNARLFLRCDYDYKVTGVLPAIRTSPAAHMNYDGGLGYDGSGFLSLFEYEPSQVCYPDGRNARQSAWYAIRALLSPYVHLIFMPPGIQQINLTEDNVRHVPENTRQPRLFNTDCCHPPARVSEDGRVIEYANRYINEYLFAGSWPLGTQVITVSRDSDVLNLLKNHAPLKDLIHFVGRHWPCPNQGDYPDQGGCGGSSGSGGIGVH